MYIVFEFDNKLLQNMFGILDVSTNTRSKAIIIKLTFNTLVYVIFIKD